MTSGVGRLCAKARDPARSSGMQAAQSWRLKRVAVVCFLRVTMVSNRQGWGATSMTITRYARALATLPLPPLNGWIALVLHSTNDAQCIRLPERPSPPASRACHVIANLRRVRGLVSVSVISTSVRAWSGCATGGEAGRIVTSRLCGISFLFRVVLGLRGAGSFSGLFLSSSGFLSARSSNLRPGRAWRAGLL